MPDRQQANDSRTRRRAGRDPPALRPGARPAPPRRPAQRGWVPPAGRVAAAPASFLPEAMHVPTTLPQAWPSGRRDAERGPSQTPRPRSEGTGAAGRGWGPGTPGRGRWSQQARMPPDLLPRPAAR
ncbi:MAG: hypothetical protein WCF99_00320 [Chloroflexales bacterium]